MNEYCKEGNKNVNMADDTNQNIRRKKRGHLYDQLKSPEVKVSSNKREKST